MEGILIPDHYTLTIRPAIQPEKRHQFEDYLKKMGYTVWGGGTSMDLTSCSISFGGPDETIKQGGMKMDEQYEASVKATQGAPWQQEPETKTPSWQEVRLEKVTNGFIIEIGCQRFVTTSWDDVALALSEYWRDPVAAQNKYLK